MMLKVRSSPHPDIPQLPGSPFLACRAHYPGGSNRCDCRLLPCPYCLPRLTGGSASTTSLSRPTQASLTLRPARLLARPKADFCPEASTRPVTRPSRSVATMLIDVYMDGSSLHWRSAPLRRTVNHRVSALDPLADASHFGRHRPWDIEGRELKHCAA